MTKTSSHYIKRGNHSVIQRMCFDKVRRMITTVSRFRKSLSPCGEMSFVVDILAISDNKEVRIWFDAVILVSCIRLEPITV